MKACIDCKKEKELRCYYTYKRKERKMSFIFPK